MKNTLKTKGKPKVEIQMPQSEPAKKQKKVVTEDSDDFTGLEIPKAKKNVAKFVIKAPLSEPPKKKKKIIAKDSDDVKADGGAERIYMESDNTEVQSNMSEKHGLKRKSSDFQSAQKVKQKKLSESTKQAPEAQFQSAKQSPQKKGSPQKQNSPRKKKGKVNQQQEESIGESQQENEQYIEEQPVEKKARLQKTLGGKPQSKRPTAGKVPCRFFQKGLCKWGSKCRFNHDQQQATKVQFCKAYQKGSCNYGEKCKFTHSTPPCRFFHTRGSCSHGEKCDFSHDPLTEDMKQFLKMPGTNEGKNNNRPSPQGGGLIQGEPEQLKLFVGGFDESMTVEKLQVKFPDARNVHISVKTSKKEGRYGFVWFSDKETCQAALEKYKDTSAIHVRPAPTKNRIDKESGDKRALCIRNFSKNTDFYKLCPDSVSVKIVKRKGKDDEYYIAFVKFASEKKAEENFNKLKSIKSPDEQRFDVDFTRTKPNTKKEKPIKANNREEMKEKRKKLTYLVLNVSGPVKDLPPTRIRNMFPEASDNDIVRGHKDLRSAFVYFDNEKRCRDAYEGNQDKSPITVTFAQDLVDFRIKKAEAIAKPDGHVCLLRGLDFSATADQVVEFFGDTVNIVGSTDGVHFTKDKKGRQNGTAYIELASAEDAQNALQKHHTTLGSRYIEVYPSKKYAMLSAMQRSKEVKPKSGSKKEKAQLSTDSTNGKKEDKENTKVDGEEKEEGDEEDQDEEESDSGEEDEEDDEEGEEESGEEESEEGDEEMDVGEQEEESEEEESEDEDGEEESDDEDNTDDDEDDDQ